MAKSSPPSAGGDRRSPSTTSEPRYLVGHEQTVFRAIYGPDGRQLATVSGDMTVRLWDLDTGKELLALRLPAREHSVPLWDFDFRCIEGRLLDRRPPYRGPPGPLSTALSTPAGFHHIPVGCGEPRGRDARGEPHRVMSDV